MGSSAGTRYGSLMGEYGGDAIVAIENTTNEKLLAYHGSLDESLIFIFCFVSSDRVHTRRRSLPENLDPSLQGHSADVTC
jgi:hypothetical protein